LANNAALTGSNLILAPSAVTKSHLSGRIVPQSGSDLETIGVLFSNFLAGKDQTLVAKGDSVIPVILMNPFVEGVAYRPHFRLAPVSRCHG
jgi:hypothetical protein